jgi:hypothetical protein
MRNANGERKAVLPQADELIKQAEQSLANEVEQLRAFLDLRQKHLMELRRFQGGTLPVPSVPSGDIRYAGKEFIDVYTEFLKRTDRPWTAEDLAIEALAGGCYAGRGGGPKQKAKGNAEAQAHKSLIYHLTTVEEKMRKREEAIKGGKKYKKRRPHPSVLKPPSLREVNGLIGLAEWPDEKFKMKAGE